MSTPTPKPDPDLTHYWTIDRAGQLRFQPDSGDGQPAGQGPVATGSITPIAGSGWINLPEAAPLSLEARALDAYHLTEILERLDARFPGYRWFVREFSARAA